MKVAKQAATAENLNQDDEDDESAGFFDNITNSTVAPKEEQPRRGRGGHRGGRGGHRGMQTDMWRRDNETFGEDSGGFQQRPRTNYNNRNQTDGYQGNRGGY